jgi:hypothetical protein
MDGRRAAPCALKHSPRAVLVPARIKLLFFVEKILKIFSSKMAS